MNYRTSLHKNMFLLIGYSKFLLLVQNSLCSRLFTKTLTSVHFFLNIQCLKTMFYYNEYSYLPNKSYKSNYKKYIQLHI